MIGLTLLVIAMIASYSGAFAKPTLHHMTVAIAGIDFIKAMQEWAAGNMAQPYKPETIEKKIKKLWQRLRLG